jgi:hypothetical protein
VCSSARGSLRTARAKRPIVATLTRAALATAPPRRAFGFSDPSIQPERRGIFRVSSDGRTLTSNARRRAVAVASCGSAAAAMIDGASFEVTLTALKGPADEKNSARLVGVAPAGALDAAGVSHVVPTSGVHMSSDGYLYVNGHRQKSTLADSDDNQHAKFGQGDTIRCQVLCGLVRFWKNGRLMFETQGVVAGAPSVFPTVTLAGLGDTVQVSTPVLHLPGAARPCGGDPLACLFSTRTLISSLPDEGEAGEEWARSRSSADVEPFLLERHIFVGLSQENLQDVARKLVQAIRGRLTVASDRNDPICAMANARAVRLKEMAPHLLKQPDADFLLHRGRSREADAGGAGDVTMYGATLSALIVATHEVVKLNSTEVISQILDALLAGVSAVEQNGLAIDNPNRPEYISESDLDSLATLLDGLMHGSNGPAAVAVAYILARKRRRFRDVLTLCSNLGNSEEGWAGAELSKVQRELVDATELWTVPEAEAEVVEEEEEKDSRTAPTVPQMWSRKPEDTTYSMLDAYASSQNAAEPSLCEYYLHPKLESAGWAFLEAPQGGILQAVKEAVFVKPKPKMPEEATDEQLWQLDSHGRLINAANKQSILQAFPGDADSWDQQAKLQPSNAVRSKDTVWEVSAVDSRGWGLLCATSASGKTAALTQPTRSADRGKPVTCSKHSSASHCANQLWRMVAPVSAALSRDESASSIAGKEHRWLVDPCPETLKLLLEQLPSSQPVTDGASLVATLKLLHRNMRALVPATAIQWIPAFEAPPFFSGTEEQTPDGTNCIGLDFIATVPITVRSLGAFLGGAAALKGRTNPLSAQLWDRGSRTLLGSVEFSAADPGFMQGGFVFKELAEPLMLPEGFEGTICGLGYDLIKARGWRANVSEASKQIEFVGSGRSGTSTEFPDTPLAGRAVALLGGNMLFAATEQVESRLVAEQPDFRGMHQLSLHLLEQLSALVRDDSDDELQLWSQSALDAAVALAMESSAQPHEFLSSQLEKCASADALTALLQRIATPRAALEYLGPHKGDKAAKNLDDSGHCMSIMEQLIALCTVTPAHSAATSAIQLLAKIQAGIAAIFLTDGARVQSVFDQYTNKLASVAIEQANLVPSDESIADRITHLCTSTVLRLWSSWAVVLGSLDAWNCLTTLTVNAVLALVKTLMVIDTTHTTEPLLQSDAVHWIVDLQQSLGHYAVSGLARAGKPDVQLSPRLQQWSALLQNGRMPDASNAISQTVTQAIADRCHTETTLEAVETGSPAASILLVAFQCLLHHCSIDVSETDDTAPPPVAVVRAYEVAHALAMQELALETEIGLGRSHSQRVLDSMVARAEFLLQYKPAPAEEGAALARSSSVGRLARASSARSNSGAPLQRQSSRRLWKRSSHTKIQVDGDQSPKVSAALSDAEADVGPERFAIMQDVASFIEADEAEEDLSFVVNNLSVTDRAVVARRQMFGQLTALLTDAGTTVSGLNLRRRVANGLLNALEPGKNESAGKEGEKPQVNLHPMDSLAGCTNDDALELSQGFGSVLIKCFEDTEDGEFEACANAACFCFAHEDHSWLGHMWDRLTKVSRGKVEPAKSLADHLRFAMAVTVSASGSFGADTTSKLVRQMMSSCCETLRSFPQTDMLSILAALLPQQDSPDGNDCVQVDSQMIRDLLAALCGILARAGRSSTWNALAPPTLLLLQRVLSLASPAQANGVLSADPSIANLLERRTKPADMLVEMFCVVGETTIHKAVQDVQASAKTRLMREEIRRWFISVGFGPTELELDELMGNGDSLDKSQLLEYVDAARTATVSSQPSGSDDLAKSKDWCLRFLGHLAVHGVPTPPGLSSNIPQTIDSQPLGCESALPDDAFTCSSFDDGPDFNPHHARLNYEKYWCAKNSDANKWIQVDLGKLCHVDAVATQAAPRANEFVKKFTVAYSSDGEEFTSYDDEHEFDGNTKKGDDIVKHTFDVPFLAQYVRICVKEYQVRKGFCLRHCVLKKDHFTKTGSGQT